LWALVQSCGDGHRSLVTPKRVLSDYNEDVFLKSEMECIRRQYSVLKDVH